MRPLRIALVLIEPPLPFGKAAGRWFAVLLKGLVARGHRVSAFAACSSVAEIAQAHDLFPAPDYDLRLFPFPERRGWQAKVETLLHPYSYMFGPDLRAELDAELARGFDVLHLEQLWSGWLGLRHADRALVNVHYLSAIDLGAECGAVDSSPARASTRLRHGKAFDQEVPVLPCGLAPPYGDAAAGSPPGRCPHGSTRA